MSKKKYEVLSTIGLYVIIAVSIIAVTLIGKALGIEEFQNMYNM